MAQENYAIETTNWALRKKTWFAKDFLKNVFTFLEKRNKIVEIGPGLGRFADECERAGMDYLAVETSEKLSKRLSERGVSVIEQAVPPHSSI